MNPNDLGRPTRIQVTDADHRDWRWLWLRKRPIWRTVFQGAYIEHMEREAYGPTRITVKST